MKIVINRCYGGFGLSEDAWRLYNDKAGTAHIYDFDIDRNDPVLVEVVELLGAKSWGVHAMLKVVEIPEGVDWYVVESAGIEHVAEQHRTWR